MPAPPPWEEGNTMEFVYVDPTRQRTLLETPSGFALFDVNEDALKEPNDIWVYFRNVATAQNVMFTLGFVKFHDKTSALDGKTRRSKELIELIKRYCNGTKPLIVLSAGLRDDIQEKLKVKCSYDPSVADELAWGMKNVLHEFVIDEKQNITREYCDTVSMGLQKCLEEHLISVSPTMLDADFISEIGLLRCFDLNLKQVPKILRESFDEHVGRIGEDIENDLMYTRVLAGILVPELAPKYDFCKMFPPDLALKIQEADKHAARYRNEQLTMHEIEVIMGALSTILSIPDQRDDILIRVKLMEAKLRRTQMMMANDTYRPSMREPTNLKHTTFRRTLLETPTGFAIFDVHEDVFKWPQRIWTQFTDDMDAREVVLALGFVNVHDKSIARDRYHGPGQELSSLIQKLCMRNTNLIVQDDALKSVIEDKLKVKCCTKFSNADDSLGDLMWGLKNVLHEFIPKEENNLTKEYYLPMSKGLQSALVSYSINGSHQQMDRKFVNVLGYLVHLDWTSSVLPIIFRKSFDRHVCWIGKLIKDDVLYAKVIEQILVPEFLFRFNFSELLPNDLAEKVSKVANNVQLAKYVQESEEDISELDKRAIMAFHEYLSFAHEKRDCYLQFLKCGGSEEDLPRIAQSYVNALNYWLMSVTKASFSVSDKLIVDGLDGLADQIRDEDQADVEVSRTREKIIGENDSSEDKSVHAESHTPNDVKPQQQETEDQLAISKGADNIDQQHCLITEGEIQGTSSAIGSSVGAKVLSVCVANGTENDCSSVTN